MTKKEAIKELGQKPPTNDSLNDITIPIEESNTENNPSGSGKRSVLLVEEVEEDSEIAEDFQDDYVRRSFIRKVYTILLVCILINLVMMVVAMFVEEYQIFLIKNYLLISSISIGVSILILLIFCCEAPRKFVPCNLILLLIHVVAMGFMLSTLCVKYSVQVIFISIAITAAIVLTLTVFAFIICIDFTKFYLFIIIGVLVLLAFGIVLIFIRLPLLHMIVSIIIVLVYSFKLIFDTQLMLGGKHKYSIHPSEYILAALSLYADITTIFVYILGLIGQDN